MRDATKNKMEEILNFIYRYSEEYGYPPSIREVCAETNIRSTATVFNYIKRLEEEGKLTKQAQKKRAVGLNTSTPTVRVPLIGTVAAGQPIFASENYDDFFAIPTNFFQGDDLFMLTVQGDSMIEVGIFNGDKIVVKKQNSADDGEIVVALVEDSATVKRFYKKADHIVLHPENSSMSDIIVPDCVILGKVVGLMRNM